MALFYRLYLTLAATVLAVGFGMSAQAQAGSWSLNGQWVATSSGGGVPGEAVTAGLENGNPISICRTLAGNGYVIGKVVRGYCYVAINGAEVQVQQFEVLVGQQDEALWGPPNIPGAIALLPDRYQADIHVCRGSLIVDGTFVGQAVGMERGGQCTASFHSRAQLIAGYQILYDRVPMGAPNTWRTGPLPQPGPSPAQPSYAPPGPYPVAPAARTSEFMDGYATFGGACVGRNDEHLQIRMAGRPDDERQLILHGDGKIHMYIPRGTVARAYCGGWPDATLRYQFRAID